MDSNIDDIKVNCHAVLTSGGGSLSERQFLSDYRSLIGGNVPFFKLGHRDLRSFLESLDGEFFYSKNRGEACINHVDKSMAHVGSLIARQKSRPKSRSRGGRRPLLRPRLPPRLNQLRLPSASSPPVIARAPPKSRYGNPPIIPQRQPLSNIQKRLNITPNEQAEVLTNVQRISNARESQQVFINKPEATSRILSTSSVDGDSCGGSSKKDSSHVKEEDEDTDMERFIDIQWLQGRVFTTNGRTVTSAAPKQDSAISKRASSVQAASNINGALGAQPVDCKSSPTPPVSVPFSPPSRLSPPPPPLSPPPYSVAVVCPVKSRTKPMNQISQKVSSHVEELRTILDNNPEYTSVELTTGGKRVFIGKVKIVKDGRDLIFSSHPEEMSTREEAQEYVAKLACKSLKEKHLENANLLVEPLDQLMITERVKSIVLDKPNGMIHSAVEQAFREIFNCVLPANWLSAIKDSEELSVEYFNNQTAIVYPSKHQVSPANMPATPVCSPDTHVVNGIPKKDIDINANTLPSNHDQVMPPKLDLPKDFMWDVFVASVSQHHVWIRLIGDQYDKACNEMLNDLELSLMCSHGQTVKDPVVNKCYAVKFDNCWCRVKLLNILKDGKAEVFLLDNGEEDEIPLHELRVLQDEYLKIPPQALQCRLSYVDLSHDKAQTYMADCVIGSTFVAEVVGHSDDDVPLIILHNTEIENKPININYEILDAIIGNLRPPQLPQEGRVSFMKIAHIDVETPPFVQIKGKDLEYLENILKDVSKQDLVLIHGVNAHPKPAQLEKSDGRMFLVRSAAAPEKWRRGVIVGQDDARYPLVYMVDFGYQEFIMMSSIFDIEKVIPPLSKYPKQAIQVDLAGIPAAQLVEGVVGRVKDLAPSESFVLGKVVGTGSSELPSVEFYKRLQPDNMIVSLNADLLFNFEQYSILKEKNERREPDKSQKKGPHMQIAALPSYSLPPVGEIFDVFCTMSSNPFNFIVQPVRELNTIFDEMMKEMQKMYEDQYRTMPTPSIDHLLEGNVFAVKHPEDLLWYRVSIVATLNESMVPVRYCDYGEVGLVSLDRLRHLDERFIKIPALSIRAKLDGVKPRNGDWSVDECVTFNKMVQNRSFVSKIEKVNPNNGLSWRVSLHLTDTSREDVDIVIADQLIELGMADRE